MITDTYFASFTSSPQRAKTLLGLAVAISTVVHDPDAPDFVPGLLKQLVRSLGPLWRADLDTLHLHDSNTASISVAGKRYAVTYSAAKRASAEIMTAVILPLLEQLNDLAEPTQRLN